MKRIIIYTLGFILIISACGTSQKDLPLSETKGENLKGSTDTQTRLPKQNTELYLTEQTNPCEKAQNQRKLENCLENEYKKLDAKLNEEYQTALKRLMKESSNEKDIINLKQTQQIWISYRESNCLSERELYEGGTDSIAVSIECDINLTNERLKEIHRIYDSK